MRLLVLSLTLALSLTAQTSLQITVLGATATQALVSYAAPTTAACTVKVSESQSYSPLVADLDPALFSGAGSDTAYTVLSNGTTRVLRIGRRTSALALDGKWHSRALASHTQHYMAVTCGAVSGSATFQTDVPHGFAPEPLPVDPNAWGDLAYPEFDFSNLSKPVIDPQTGLKIYSADPTTWSTNITLAVSANWFGGGTGWTQPANISSYSTAVATTANTNPLAIYVDTTAFADGFRVSGGYWPYDNFLDLGVDLYGSGSDTQTPANRTVQMALSLDSGQTPYTQWVNATLPTSAGAAGTFPAQYPSTYFTGWGKILPRKAWPRRGLVTVSGGIVALTGNDVGSPVGRVNYDDDSYFDQDWAAGTKIWINNSAPACVNNFCTIASVQNATQLTISEALTLSQNQYRSAALAVMVQKTTATGSVGLSARLHVAKGYPQNIWSGGCAPQTVTAGDGVVGYPCIFPTVRAGPGALYFVGASQPVIRLVSLFVNPKSINGVAAADLPSGSISLLGPGVPAFDPNDPTVVYAAIPTGGGSLGLFRVQYTGDWSALNVPWQQKGVTPPVTNELAWQNMTPSASGRDMRSQILANTNYNEHSWGALTSLQALGVSGKYAAFAKLIGSQESACWIFLFDSSTGTFYRGWRTDDGSSLPQLKYAGCHNVSPEDVNLLFLASNGLRAKNVIMPYGGPFSSPILATQRNGVFDSSNTALPWPPVAPPATNGYDTNCPTDLNPAWIANGATGNQCVTVQMNEPCSSYASATEASHSPCPWDSTKSMIAPLAEGDFLKQSGAVAGFGTWDNEGYMVVRITPAGNNVLNVVLQRNADTSYCSFGKDGIASASQLMPANGWAVDAVPPFACQAVGFLLDIPGNKAYAINQNLTRGHFSVTGVPGTTNITWIGSGLSGSTWTYPIAYNRPASLFGNPIDFNVSSSPNFAGYNSNVTNIQGYIDAKQMSATGDVRSYAFDFRHYNGSLGLDLEAPNQSLGGATNLALQPGTTSVFKVTYTGTPDIKHMALNVWAGEKYLIEKSSASAGNTLTDADAWHFCYASAAGECRTGSGSGDLYAAIPRADVKSNCWASQINLRVACAMAGPALAMRATQVRISTPDASGTWQRTLGSMLMGPGHQYVYSNVLPTPNASYILFAGFLTNGYHTSLMMAQLPPVPNDSVAGWTFIPVKVSGTSTNAVYVEFGYEEYGAPGDFHCTPRQEVCRVAAAQINLSTPFWYAHELFPTTTGDYQISIPALPGRILYYHVVDGGVAGPLRAKIPGTTSLKTQP